MTTTTEQTPLAAEASREERIARRAHELFLSRGGQDGRALDDWLQAEAELDERETPAA